MASLQLTGTIHSINDAEQKTEKLKKQDFRIMTDEKYPQKIKFQLLNERCGMADGFSIGQKVSVYFNVRGFEVTKQTGEKDDFINLDCWKIEAVN